MVTWLTTTTYWFDGNRNHEKLNHPMTKDQLEEVWEEQDHMDAKVELIIRENNVYVKKPLL